MADLELSRSQILGFRRLVGSLDERLPAGTKSLRRAAWAGLQDSMPRALCCRSMGRRVEGTAREPGSTRPLSNFGPAVQQLRCGCEGSPCILLGDFPRTPVAAEDG